MRSFAGTAPITRASGRSRVVSARRICNRRLGDACHWRAYATLTRSPGAHYDRRKAAGDTRNAALRNLANKLLSKLWHCLQTNALPRNKRLADTRNCRRLTTDSRGVSAAQRAVWKPVRMPTSACRAPRVAPRRSIPGVVSMVASTAVQ